MNVATVVDALEARAPAGEETAVWFEGSSGLYDRVDCAGLLAHAERTARALMAKGVGAGDRVVIVLPTSPEFVYTFYGTLCCGATAVPLYPPTGAHQLDAFTANLDRVLALTRAAVVVTLAPLADTVPAGVRVILPEELAGGADADDAPLPRPRADDLALIQFSSGSTGDPRGVALTHHNVVTNIRAYQEAATIHPPDVCVSWLPLYHDMGLIGVLIGTVVTQIPLALASPLDFLGRPRLWLEMITKYRGSIAVSPQFGFNLALAKLADDDLADLDLASVRVMLNGAEPTDLDVIRRFEERFRAAGLKPGVITPCYGLAEHTLAVTMGAPGREVPRHHVRRDSGEVVPGGKAADGTALTVASDGPPVPGAEVAILDRDGSQLPDETIGEIAVRSECICKGYVTADGIVPATDAKGWLRTGDLGFLSDGELFALDRLKDTIVVAGRNVYAHDVERAVAAVDGIRPGRAVVFGIRDAELGTESLVVAAETNPGERKELLRRAAAVRQAVLGATGLAPYDVVLLPKGRVALTSSGKVRRHRVKREFAEGAFQDEALVSLRATAMAGATEERDEAVA